MYYLSMSLRELGPRKVISGCCVVSILLALAIDIVLQGIGRPLIYTVEAAEAAGLESKPKTIRIEIAKTVPPIMERIADCESGDGSLGSGRQFLDNSSVVTGHHAKVGVDIGKWQINTYHHLARARALNIDIYTELGNEKYAMILYSTQGLKPWEASKGCWSK